MARGKVITTHLITGDPNGMRTVFISNKICEMIVFPKTEFDKGIIEEISHPALYILLGEDDNGNSQAYIGETTNGLKRLSNHKIHKLFWNKCLLFVAKDDSINKADVQYLENRAIDVANECARYILTNEQVGKENSLSKYQIDIMEEFFDDVKLLSSFIGCNIFDKKEPADSFGNNVFHIRTKGIQANGVFNETDHSIRLLKGSLCPQATVKSYRDAVKRNALLASIAKKTTDGYWKLERDYVLDSPSTAASYVVGGNRNGWKEWINDNGMTLDEIYRNE